MFGRKSPNAPPRDPLLGKPASFGLHRYLQGSSNLFEENRLLKLAVVGLFGITAVLGTLIYTSNQNTRTVVVPFGASGDLYVTGSEPSEAYLRTITRNVVSLSGTYSAYSADRQFQELLSIATYIRPDQPVTWTKTEILVPVEKVRVIGGVIRKFRGNLRIRYVIDNGRFWLTALTEENFDAQPR